MSAAFNTGISAFFAASLPLPKLNEELYFKHFKRKRPENIRSIE